MRLNRWLIAGCCLTCFPLTGVLAGPQSDDLKITAVVQVDDDGDETNKDSKSKESKSGSKERKTLRLQLNKGQGPVVIMAARGADDENQDKKLDEERAEAAPPKIWLGLGLKEISGDLATYLGSSEGVFVESVFPDSPAAAAKLQEGDIVTGFQGKKVVGPGELVAALRAVDAVDSADKEDAKAKYPKVSLTILRRGQEVKVELTPTDRPENLKVAHDDDTESLLDGASFFKFGEPGDAKLKLMNPLKHFRSNVVVVVKEDGKEYIARIERDGDNPPKIIVTKDKEEQQLREDQLDRLPEKVREAIQKALKANHTFEFKASSNGTDDDVSGDSKQQAFAEVREQLEKAMQQVGGGKLNIEMKDLTESLKGLGEGRVIIVDPAKLQDMRKMSEDAIALGKKWSDVGAAQARNYAALPDQVKELKQQVEDLKHQLEELKAEIKAGKN